MPADAAPPDHRFARRIAGTEAFSIVAGSMLGIGIFLAPPLVASHLGDPVLFLAMWALGGLVSLSGAVACAELGAMMPRAGGDYEIQFEAYGPSVAFASGWTLFAAIFCGSIAAMTVALCTYQIPSLSGVDPARELLRLPGGTGVNAAQATALAVVALLTLLNSAGMRPSALVQTATTVVPVAILAAAALGVTILAPSAPPPAASGPAIELTAGGFAASWSAVYFAYSGWINILYVAGEVARPERTIPRALVAGTLVVTLLYLLLCAGFLQVLGIEGLRTAGEAGTASARRLAGEPGAIAFTILVAMALVASINATILGGARVAWAMARRGAMLGSLDRLGRRSGVPTRALWLQAALSSLLILSGAFEDLLQMVSLAMVVTGTLTVGSVFVLRRSQPRLPRPYRATAYPWLPAFYVASSGVIVSIMLHEAWSGQPKAWQRLFGLGLAAGLYALHRSVLAGRRAG